MSLYIELTTTDPDTGKDIARINGDAVVCYVLHERTRRSMWYATLDGAQRMGKYIEEMHPEDEVMCSSSVDFASDYGIDISRDAFDDAVHAGRRQYLDSQMPRVVTRSVEVRVLMQIDVPPTATALDCRAAALECVRFYPGMSTNAVLHGKTASLIG